eukprot:CAMPEP_0117556774 /NCGR_PEP_ID=MMETSP0784-20121206/51982_1 /TAXON_ID=39447 /ORGANISM="" /LENGTH=832 /DNA_ID=CAMNT_0005354059 /DNA_START=32 /DNA_END=2530 /DNA_ORIENTATION=+
MAPAICRLFGQTLGVDIPRRIRIRNARLFIFQTLMQASVLVFCLHIAYRFKPWLGQREPKGAISFWFELGADYEASVKKEMEEADVCDTSTNQRYDYVWEDGWSFTNMTCAIPEEHQKPSKLMESLFVPTYISETYREMRAIDAKKDCASACADLSTPANGTTEAQVFEASSWTNDYGECVCQASRTSKLFIVGVGDVVLGMEPIALVPPEDQRGVVEMIEQKSKAANVLTVFRHHDSKKEAWRVAPSESISIKVSQLLELSGFDLESKLPTNRNLITRDGVHPYPVVRITGLELHITLHSHNKLSTANLHADEHDGPVCYVDINAIPKWTASPVSFYTTAPDRRGNSMHTLSYRYGIDIRFATFGDFAAIDVQTAFAFFASCFVYMQLPHLVILFIVLFTLGPSSTVFAKARTETLEVSDLLHRVLCRAISCSLVYQDMLDLQNVGCSDPCNCLTPATIGKHLFEIFRNREDLDPMGFAILLEEFLHHLDPDNTEKVTQDTFIECIMGGDMCGTSTLASMYDLRRKHGIFEHVFENNSRKVKRMARRSEQDRHETESRLRTLTSTASPRMGSLRLSGLCAEVTSVLSSEWKSEWRMEMQEWQETSNELWQAKLDDLRATLREELEDVRRCVHNAPESAQLSASRPSAAIGETVEDAMVVSCGELSERTAASQLSTRIATLEEILDAFQAGDAKPLQVLSRRVGVLEQREESLSSEFVLLLDSLDKLERRARRDEQCFAAGAAARQWLDRDRPEAQRDRAASQASSAPAPAREESSMQLGENSEDSRLLHQGASPARERSTPSGSGGKDHGFLHGRAPLARERPLTLAKASM